MTNYLHLDCEMGGRELKFSLLTACFIVIDETNKVIDTLNLKVKPDDGVYILSGQGMSVNKINIQEHDKIAITYKQAKPLLYDFLKKYSAGSHLVPVGHGVKGDIQHIIDKLISEGSWEQFCTYHYIDTSVVLQFLRACGKMPMDTDGSVKALAEYFGLWGNPCDDDTFHDAKFDAEMTMKIFQKMVDLGKS